MGEKWRRRNWNRNRDIQVTKIRGTWFCVMVFVTVSIFIFFPLFVFFLTFFYHSVVTHYCLNSFFCFYLEQTSQWVNDVFLFWWQTLLFSFNNMQTSKHLECLKWFSLRVKKNQVNTCEQKMNVVWGRKNTKKSQHFLVQVTE